MREKLDLFIEMGRLEAPALVERLLAPTTSTRAKVQIRERILRVDI